MEGAAPCMSLRSTPRCSPGTKSLGRFLEDRLFPGTLNREQLRRQWQKEKKARNAAPAKRAAHD